MDGGSIVAYIGAAIMSCTPIHAIGTTIDTRLRWNRTHGTVIRTGQHEIKEGDGGYKNVFYPLIRVTLTED